MMMPKRIEVKFMKYGHSAWFSGELIGIGSSFNHRERVTEGAYVIIDRMDGEIKPFPFSEIREMYEQLDADPKK